VCIRGRKILPGDDVTIDGLVPCAESKKRAKRFKAAPVARLVWAAKLSRRKIVGHRQRASLIRFQGNLLG
jgi:hypothetical protein